MLFPKRSQHMVKPQAGSLGRRRLLTFKCSRANYIKLAENKSKIQRVGNLEDAEIYYR
jgi:hypothetical protein